MLGPCHMVNRQLAAGCKTYKTLGNCEEKLPTRLKGSRSPSQHVTRKGRTDCNGRTVPPSSDLSISPSISISTVHGLNLTYLQFGFVRLLASIREHRCILPPCSSPKVDCPVIQSFLDPWCVAGLHTGMPTRDQYAIRGGRVVQQQRNSFC